MISSNIYNYIDVLNKAANASWVRNEVLANNIAHADTPGYKRKDVDFENTLKRELKNGKYKSLDSRMRDVSISDLTARTYTDSSGYSYRLDKNNVDIDTENVELASNQIKYNAYIDVMNQEFRRIKSVLK